MDVSFTQLHQFITRHYDLEELRTLCVDLSVDLDSLRGEGKAAKARELVLWMGRGRRLDKLLNALHQDRPEAFDHTGLSVDSAVVEALYAELPSWAASASVTTERITSATERGVAVGRDVSGAVLTGDIHGPVTIITGEIKGDVRIEQVPELEIAPPPKYLIDLPDTTAFVGRETELAYFAEKLADTNLAVISGFPGVGKTQLAAVLTSRVKEKDKTFWHSFRKNEGIGEVIRKLARFLFRQGLKDLWHMLETTRLTSGQPRPTRELLEYLAQMIGGQEYSLCFDDWQFLFDEDAEQLGQFVEQLIIMETSIIITSRQAPKVGRWIGFDELGGLSLADTRSLLVKRKQSVSDDLVTTLHQQTEGNAQFLMLATAVMEQASNITDLTTELMKADNIELYLLDKVDQGLTEDEREVMWAVAVLMGYPGTRDAIEAVADKSGLQRILLGLRNRYLLNVSRGEADREYSQHALLQAFYYEMLGKRKRRLMHHRTGEYYATEERDVVKAARHFWEAEEHRQAAHLVTDDVWALINQGRAHGLRQLLERFSAQQLEAEDWVSVNLARGQVYTLLGQGQQAQESYQEALSQLTGLPDSPAVRELRARAYRGMGEAAKYANPGEAKQWLQRGLDELADVDTLEKALLHLRLGIVLRRLRDFPTASSLLEQSLRLLPEGPSDWRASAMGNLGVVHAAQGHLDMGKDYFERALEMYQLSHNYWGMVGIWQNLGMVLEISGDWSGAVAEYNKAIEHAERLGSVERQVMLELCVGVLLTNQGDLETAKTRLSASLERARRHNLKVQQVHIQSWLAELQIRLEDWGAAERSLNDAEKLALEIDVKDQLPEIYRGWAQVRLGGEKQQVALDYAEHAVNLAREMGVGPEEGMSLRVLGQALVAGGEYERAIEAFERSLALLEGHDPYEAARTKVRWGLALVQGGDIARGKRLLVEAKAAFQDLGARYDEAVADAIDVL